MAYWDAHPLAGDQPEDSILTLANEFGLDDALAPEFRVRILQECKSVVGIKRLLGTLIEDQYFVVPFLLAHLHIRVADAEAVALLKMLIGDGGSKFRGYAESDKSALQRTPSYYAERLDYYWDGLMSGAVPFEQVARRPGLLEALGARIVEDEVDAMVPKAIGYDE